MLEHLKQTLDGIRHRHEHPTDTSSADQQAQSEHDNEFRCWNCGEYIDAVSEICPYCGHSPDPIIADFTRKSEE